MLVETAFTNFKKMYEVCDLHAARECHKDAIAVCDAFVERMRGKQDQRDEAREITEQQKEALVYHRDNCLVWSAEHCSQWSSL